MVRIGQAAKTLDVLVSDEVLEERLAAWKAAGGAPGPKYARGTVLSKYTKLVSHASIGATLD